LAAEKLYTSRPSTLTYTATGKWRRVSAHGVGSVVKISSADWKPVEVTKSVGPVPLSCDHASAIVMSALS